jgi:hypothetical protein
VPSRCRRATGWAGSSSGCHVVYVVIGGGCFACGGFWTRAEGAFSDGRGVGGPIPKEGKETPRYQWSNVDSEPRGALLQPNCTPPILQLWPRQGRASSYSPLTSARHGRSARCYPQPFWLERARQRRRRERLPAAAGAGPPVSRAGLRCRLRRFALTQIYGHAPTRSLGPPWDKEAAPTVGNSRQQALVLQQVPLVHTPLLQTP